MVRCKCPGDMLDVCRRIDCEQLQSGINKKLIAGFSSHKGLHHLRICYCYIIARNQFACIEECSNFCIYVHAWAAFAVF